MKLCVKCKALAMHRDLHVVTLALRMVSSQLHSAQGHNPKVSLGPCSSLAPNGREKMGTPTPTWIEDSPSLAGESPCGTDGGGCQS